MNCDTNLLFSEGMIIVNTEPYELDLFKYSCRKEFVQNEDELFNSFVKVIRHYDPDMFLGYEVILFLFSLLYFASNTRNTLRNRQQQFSYECVFDVGVKRKDNILFHHWLVELYARNFGVLPT